jgi:hypothetical protein
VAKYIVLCDSRCLTVEQAAHSPGTAPPASCVYTAARTVIADSPDLGAREAGAREALIPERAPFGMAGSSSAEGAERSLGRCGGRPPWPGIRSRHRLW